MRVMSPFRRCFALLLIAALAVTALTVARGASDQSSARTGEGEIVSVVRLDNAHVSMVRITTDNRRPVSPSDRLLKQRSILLAVMAAVFVGLVLRRRSPIVSARSAGILSFSWLPQSGRAPPAFNA